MESGETTIEEVLTLVKKDPILNKEEDPQIDIGVIFYPKKKIPVYIKGKRAYLFDLSKKGISFIFDEVFFLSIDEPIDINVDKYRLRFIPKSYKKHEDDNFMWIIGGLYEGDLHSLMEQ